MKKKYITKNDNETIDLGRKLGLLLKGGEIILLEGDLGGGKTTFSKGLALGLGVEAEVTSPTFTIEQVYKGRDSLTVFHYDFYRLGGGDIAEMEFLESIKSDKTVVIVEWPQVLKELLPEQRIEIKFTYLDENKREIEIEGVGEKGEEIIRKFLIPN
ncbi:TPA: tRNA (adenosine(37)-N6)-threonylcarbamoyltransferase complex ATPase subunit type 1 TsaE [candidate division CPR2 bacterium]|uniref:tRNA threonylcarbamoyladenosine biosynthesis protein TsaE n=1 Tax=candidate division CPR2 bacterium GW2011_GWC1_41_48 TaxID=1618344 RepID=A0A0G0W877_UNCC2|nr:MAG: Nucleotide-binding protein [candidate division CPR2 bacterium GW2011_GWC2_39_35]KKR29286.1 MAG: Nucleotide-binding protein [candidate division CPR2 bacterium GW2011_GWD2_39_7]KKR29646.1 MAG: Nucleotide-binding protein [candidate division CPR2 bacterium GW2011_GWD1_39_7]KKS09180.1 MAG: Nucleotide-binding protein [candidate division CPR2 bacterium GW2011_GWC1_41_48]OGB56934.1 MAG: tRNA (adenosine(37)-N6)-threonylcarbamoyltransferase complex ATPase subunit type 1 TsaE [candidate division C